MHIYSFEKLEVWQLSRKFIVKIYKVTSNFPDEEKYGLISQLRRASVSIASNLAEGSSRTGLKDKAHFSVISYSSLMEVLNQVIISLDLEFIMENTYRDLRTDIDMIANKLNAFHKHQEEQIVKTKL